MRGQEGKPNEKGKEGGERGQGEELGITCFQKSVDCE